MVALTVANRFSYATWGAPTVTTHNGHPDHRFRYRYVGRHGVADDTTTLIATGLHYMHARHYSSEFGRFLTPDPAALETNLYAYAGNSPVTKVDPEGTAAVAVAVAAAWCLANFWTCSALVATGAIYVGTAAGWLINNPPRISICLWNCGPTDTHPRRPSRSSLPSSL